MFGYGPIAVGSRVLAHGLGGRTDLPIDPKMAAIGAAVAVGVSFLIVAIAWPQQQLAPAAPGRPLPAASRLINSQIFVGTLRLLVLAVAAVVVAVALFGPGESRFNLAPYALYVIFWVGLAFVSVLLGPVWRRLNPLRTLHTLLCRLAGRDPDEAMFRLPDGIGVWPAAAGLLVFVWLELVYPQRGQPYVVGLLLMTYAVVMVVLALAFGRRWFDTGDAFELYSRLFGSMSMLGARSDGLLVLRSPLNSLRALAPVPGLAAAVVVLIGSTGFDGLTRTSYWQRSVPADSVVLGTAGLFALVAAVGLLYAVAARAGGRAGRLSEHEANAADRPGRAAMTGLFAHALVPIASATPWPTTSRSFCSRAKSRCRSPVIRSSGGGICSVQPKDRSTTRWSQRTRSRRSRSTRS